MPGIVGGLESYQVGCEEAAQEVLTDGKAPEDLGGGEGNVQEETNGGVLRESRRGTEEGGEEHQVVIIDPN